VVFGVGATGSVATRLMLEKGVEVVGALARSPEKVGKDLGEVAGLDTEVGVTVEDDPERVLGERRPDIAIVTTGNYMDDVFDHLKLCAEAGANVATLAAELLYPWRSSPAATARLDRIAKEHGVSITATGHQDIYWVHLIGVMMGSSHTVTAIKGTVAWNIDDFGPQIAREQRVGDSAAEFTRWLEGAERPPTVGRNTLDCLAADLGMVVASRDSETKPEMVDEDRYCRALDSTVPAGDVIGFTDIDSATTTSGVELTFEMLGRVAAAGESDVNEWRVSGEPELVLTTPDLPSGMTTVTQLVNRIPDIVNAPPGFVTIEMLPRPRYRPYPFEVYIDRAA
jgi:4-hydroxy-tetrahydrodipicolinate reductase